MKFTKCLVSIAISSGLLQSNIGFAACSLARPGDCVSGTAKAIEQTLNGGPDRSEIHLLNKCNKAIRVGINYLPSPQNDGAGWQAKAWYNLAPGGQAFIGYSKTRFFYSYAETTDGATTWKGNECFNFSGAGRNLCTTKVDMGSKITTYTYNYSCN